jgi:sarcosine oxidase subunit gamma
MVEFEVRAVPAGRAILHLKTWARVGTSLPALGSSLPSGARLLALGPDEWLMISDSVDGPGLHDAVAALAHAHKIAAVDVSQAMAGLQLEGSTAREVLSTGCGLDLHPKAFPIGSCTRTRLAQLPVVIECTPSPMRYELYVGASYRPYLEKWLEDAAAKSL